MGEQSSLEKVHRSSLERAHNDNSLPKSNRAEANRSSLVKVHRNSLERVPSLHRSCRARARRNSRVRAISEGRRMQQHPENHPRYTMHVTHKSARVNAQGVAHTLDCFMHVFCPQHTCAMACVCACMYVCRMICLHHCSYSVWSMARMQGTTAGKKTAGKKGTPAGKAAANKTQAKVAGKA